MSTLQSLLETEEAKNFLTENQDLILEAAQSVDAFGGVIKEYVVQNPDFFIESDLETTYKNIRVFSEIATAQYLTEMVAICDQEVSSIEEAKTNYDPLGDYL
ncbi:MAG: hypothetical protein ACOCZ5_00825 [bacterium]